MAKRKIPRGFSTWSEYYQYRIAQGEKRGLSRSQARGHPKKGELPASKIPRTVRILGRSGPIDVELIGTRNTSRAGSYDNDVQVLLRGRLSPNQFDRRWKGKAIGGVILPGANEVIAMAHQGIASFDDFYPGRAA